MNQLRLVFCDGGWFFRGSIQLFVLLGMRMVGLVRDGIDHKHGPDLLLRSSLLSMGTLVFGDPKKGTVFRGPVGNSIGQRKKLQRKRRVFLWAELGSTVEMLIRCNVVEACRACVAQRSEGWRLTCSCEQGSSW